MIKSLLNRLSIPLFILITLVLLCSLPETGLSSPLREVNKESSGLRIGVVYQNPYEGYYEQGIQYRSLIQRFREELCQLAIEKEFTLVEIMAYTPSFDPISAEQYLIEEEVDAIIFYYREPLCAARAVSDAHATGIPIVLCGFDPPVESNAPFIGNDLYHIGIKTGEKTADLFKQRFPGEQPKLLIADSKIEKKDIDLEKGFVEGIMRSLPDLYIERTPDDMGSIENMRYIVLRTVHENPDLNIFFGTSDIRAMSIMLALESQGRGTLDMEIVAGYGGSTIAMEELIRPTCAWKIEAGIPVAEYVEKTYEILEKMLSGEMPMNSTDVYLLDAQYFVEPTTWQIHEYLKRNGELKEAKLFKG